MSAQLAAVLRAARVKSYSKEANLDRACWISWYNLADEVRDDYLAWAHREYLPRVLERSGILWGAHYASETNFTPLGGGDGRIRNKKNPEGVPIGDRFIMMFGASDTHVLTNPSPSEYHAGLPVGDRNMLAQRADERMNIMMEDARIRGPEASPAADLTPGPCIQLGSFNARSYEDEEELAAWYARWRLPSLKTLPGIIGVRKLVSVCGWAKHACLYEFTSLEARDEHFVRYEDPNPEMAAWSTRVVRDTVHAPGSANVAKRIWPPVNN